jgi:hypothetical protein
MGIDLHLSTCVDTQSPKYLEMAQGHISLSGSPRLLPAVLTSHQNTFAILLQFLGYLVFFVQSILIRNQPMLEF